MGERVIFDKNPYYWQKDEQGNQLPNIDKIIWVFIDSLDTSFLQFRSGSLDTFWVNPEYFSLLKREEKRGNFTIYNGGVNYGTRFLAFNLNQGSRKGKSLVNPIKSQWFNNINFRKAIAYGIDCERMINNIYRGLGATLNTQISVQSPYYNDNITGYNYDFDKAKKILLQEGFIYIINNLYSILVSPTKVTHCQSIHNIYPYLLV